MSRWYFVLGSLVLAIACSSDDDPASATTTTAASGGGTTSAATGGSATSGSTGGGTAGTGGSVSYSCTQVIGYSQVNQWYTANGAFEPIVDDASWQLLWNGGAGVDQWQDPNYTGWDNNLVSPCAQDSTAPGRVLLSISGPFGADESGWATAIQATITTIRSKLPSVGPIVLQPVVGGPNHMDCFFNSMLIRASWQHAHIDNAIATVVAGDVLAGFSPEVADCTDYSDALGHLTNMGAETAGQTIGQFYLSF